MNAVFTKRENQQVLLHYENLQFFCEKNGTAVYLKPADHYTGLQLDCEPGSVCGWIRWIGEKKIVFEFRDEAMGYEAACLYTYQTSCLPWLMDMLFPKKALI